MFYDLFLVLFPAVLGWLDFFVRQGESHVSRGSISVSFVVVRCWSNCSTWHWCVGERRAEIQSC